MKVKIIYDDNVSLTSDEIIENNKHLFGNNATVEVYPNNKSPESYIYHGIQKLITEDQITLFFDKGQYLYQEEMPELKKKLLEKIDEILNQVIIDNEERVT